MKQMFKNLVTNVNQNQKKLSVNFSNDYYKKGLMWPMWTMM